MLSGLLGPPPLRCFNVPKGVFGRVCAKYKPSKIPEKPMYSTRALCTFCTICNTLPVRSVRFVRRPIPFQRYPYPSKHTLATFLPTCPWDVRDVRCLSAFCVIWQITPPTSGGRGLSRQAHGRCSGRSSGRTALRSVASRPNKNRQTGGRVSSIGGGGISEATSEPSLALKDVVGGFVAAALVVSWFAVYGQQYSALIVDNLTQKSL